MRRKVSIYEALEREVHKLIKRHNRSIANSVLDRKRYERRSGIPGDKKKSHYPIQWRLDPHFNPYHVRSRLDSFAHAISRKIARLEYRPDPTLLLSIPKPGGGERKISISSIPDAAVSYWLGKRLIDRNAYRFSSYSYAYREDRNAHHALEHLMTSIRNKQRVYILEYDFAKYFDSIRHEYLWDILSKYFLITNREFQLLKDIVTNRQARSVEDYENSIFYPREIGIPQGSNVSLFLANVACYELDREIEQVGVTFARYADDTLVICESYDKANKCAKLLFAHGDRSGTRINFRKSPGISLLTFAKNTEIQSKQSVVYLSHELSSRGIAISDKAIKKMKRRIAIIIYNNLLLQPKRSSFNPKRVGLGYHDWDLVTCINEIRRYVYGRISENSLDAGLSGTEKVNTTLCAMSFYPTVDKSMDGNIRALDGWLVDTLHRAYKKRCKLLRELGVGAVPIERDRIISGDWYSYDRISVETRLPSFYRAWLYVKKASEIYGLEKFPSPAYDYI